MKPTRAPEMSERTPSSIPTPARRIGQTATFLPEMRGTVVRSSGVEISTSSVASSFVASYVRSRVSSFTSWRKTCVGVSMSRSIPSLCWTSGWSTTVRRSVATFMGQLLAYERVEGVRGNREVPPRHQRRGSVGETWFPPRERAEGERPSLVDLPVLPHEADRGDVHHEGDDEQGQPDGEDRLVLDGAGRDIAEARCPDECRHRLGRLTRVRRD